MIDCSAQCEVVKLKGGTWYHLVLQFGIQPLFIGLSVKTPNKFQGSPLECWHTPGYLLILHIYCISYQILPIFNSYFLSLSKHVAVLPTFLSNSIPPLCLSPSGPLAADRLQLPALGFCFISRLKSSLHTISFLFFYSLKGYIHCKATSNARMELLNFECINN